jgi:hypothetical protein
VAAEAAAAETAAAEAAVAETAAAEAAVAEASEAAEVLVVVEETAVAVDQTISAAAPAATKSLRTSTPPLPARRRTMSLRLNCSS